MYENTKQFIVQKSARYGIILGALALIILVFQLIRMFFQLFLPSFVANLFVVGLFVVLLKNVTRLLVFPGSFKFWRRNIENHYGKAISKRALGRIRDALAITEAITFQKGYINVPIEDFQPIRRTILSFINTFNEMAFRNMITSQQQHLLQTFLQVEQNFKEMTLASNLVIWDLFDDPAHLINLISQKEKLVSITTGQDTLSYLQQIESILNDILCEKSCLQSVKRWFFNRTLGTGNQMRVELETQFRTRRIQLKSYDGTMIDWFCHLLNYFKSFLILGQNLNSVIPEEQYDQDRKLQDSDANNVLIDIGPTILFCNPNAGYYEYMYYESEWIEYYTKKGVNLFLWNYRGYGDSQGYPGTQTIQNDGEYIIDFIRDELKVKHLGVHGESLGGMVAVHLAKTRKVDFLFADRTFSSLSEVAQFGFSKYARCLFNFVTNWNYNVGQAYQDCTQYKLIATDPKDEVIPFMGSILISVARNVFLREFSGDALPDEQNPNASYDQIVIRKTFREEVLSYWYEWKQRFKWSLGNSSHQEFVELFYQKMLNKPECDSLFQALKRISNILIETANFRNKERKDSNESLNTSNFLNEQNKSQNDSMYTEAPQTEVRSQPQNETNFLNESFKEDLPSSKAMLKYIDDVPESERGSAKFQQFVMQIFSTFDGLEVASISLNEVFRYYKEEDQHVIMIYFFISMFLWGSYLPLRYIPKKKMNTLLCQKLAYARLNEFMKKLDSMIKAEKKEGQLSPISRKILNDLELVIIRMKEMRESFKKLIRTKGRFSQEGREEEKMNDTIMTASKLMEPINRQMGNLLPVNCGHNGVFSKRETDVLDYHLKMSGLVKDF